MKNLQTIAVGLFALLIFGTATLTRASEVRSVRTETLRAGTLTPRFVQHQQRQRQNIRYKQHKSKIKPSSVKVFLVAVGNNGKIGRKIGCGDSLVAVTRSVKPTAAILKSAIEELLNLPRNYNEKLENFWSGGSLKVKSVSITKGVATIQLTGDVPVLAGACDGPRLTSQIEQTAKQFSTVKEVKIFIKNQSLARILR